MKRLLCIFLATLIIFTATAPYASANPVPFPQEDLPVIVVRGMDFGAISVDLGDGSSHHIMDIDSGELIQTLFKSFFARITGGTKGATDVVLDYLNGMFKYIGCDENGTPVYPSTMPTYPLSLNNYPDLLEGRVRYAESTLARAMASRYGAENTYYFAYDWRENPLVVCNDLAEMVDLALADSGKDKVNIVSGSMGGVEVLAYMSQYGYGKLNKLIFDSSAFYGTYLASDLMTGRVEASAEGLNNFLQYSTADNNFLNFIVKFLNSTGILKSLSSGINKLIVEQKDHIRTDFLLNTFAYIPSFWAVVLPEDYETALDFVFEDDRAENEYFINLTAELQDMMAGRDELLNTAMADGVGISVIASYNSPMVPLYARSTASGDGVLESALMLGGAVVAPYGKTLGDDYETADPAMLSPDRMVDLSTVLFPNHTWAMKNGPHVGGAEDSEYADFMFWIFDFEGQPTVHDSEMYPRFMSVGSGQSLLAH